MERKEKTQVLVVATMDTKGEEAAYLATCLEKLGLKPLIMDPGIRGNPDLPVFVSRQEVASRGGTTLGEVQSIPHEGRALNAMIVGAVKVAAELYEQGAIRGVVSIGGSMGTTLGSSVMRALPFGFPKVMISTMASRNTRAFVGTRDILMLHSVCDLAGLNRMTRKVLENGAGALAGMVNSGLMESGNETTKAADCSFDPGHHRGMRGLVASGPIGGRFRGRDLPHERFRRAGHGGDDHGRGL